MSGVKAARSASSLVDESNRLFGRLSSNLAIMHSGIDGFTVHPPQAVVADGRIRRWRRRQGGEAGKRRTTRRTTLTTRGGGTPGCNLPDFHDGPCSCWEVSKTRKRGRSSAYFHDTHAPILALYPRKAGAAQDKIKRTPSKPLYVPPSACTWVQCETCCGRRLPSANEADLPEVWTCDMHPNSLTCETPRMKWRRKRCSRRRRVTRFISHRRVLLRYLGVSRNHSRYKAEYDG